MPAGDRTGPMGMGPMTGRGAGLCGGGAPGRGLGMGFRGGRGGGFGFRGGFGGGFGRGFGGRSAAMAGPVAWSPEQESRALRERADLLQAELDAVRRRMDDLGTADGQ